MKNELIQIKDKFYQECEVIILSTEKSNLILSKGQLHLSKAAAPTNKEIDHTAQHLYILSNEEIKEREEQWIACKDAITTHIFLCSGGLNNQFGWHKKDSNTFYTKEACKKIIATTNSSLNHNTYLKGKISGEYPLPRPSSEFLQAYCKANGKIDRVLVEYEKFELKDKFTTLDSIKPTFYKLKLSPDNTITIKSIQLSVEEAFAEWHHNHLKSNNGLYPYPIDAWKAAVEWRDNNPKEKVWNRKEVIALLKSFRNADFEYLEEEKDIETEQIEEWINSNLET